MEAVPPASLLVALGVPMEGAEVAQAARTSVQITGTIPVKGFLCIVSLHFQGCLEYIRPLFQHCGDDVSIL
jgi:hypothetical protein